MNNELMCIRICPALALYYTLEEIELRKLEILEANILEIIFKILK